jgi:serine/threonine-protein kinase
MAEAGTVLADRYRLLELIAAGEAAESWRAADLPFGRDVVVRLSLTRHAGHAERFLAVARRAARVIHPGIVRVLDCGRSGPEGIPFLVTELAGSSSLATLTQAGPLDPPWVLEVVWLLAGALETAHAAGLVHQNITSANVLLVPGGAVKLTDLALSDAAEPDVGTPAGDLCALGMVAWECLTGAAPLSAAPTLSAARPLPAVVPPGLAALVADLTTADLRAYPATAAEVATRAGELLADQKIVDHYAQPRVPLYPLSLAIYRKLAAEATGRPGSRA